MTFPYTLIGILMVLNLGTVYGLVQVRRAGKRTTEALQLVQSITLANGPKVEALERKFMDALKRGIDAQNAIHQEQGKLAINVAARLAAIETLLSHSRRGYGSQLSSLYQRAKAELERRQEESLTAPAPSVVRAAASALAVGTAEVGGEKMVTAEIDLKDYAADAKDLPENFGELPETRVMVNDEEVLGERGEASNG